MKSTSSCKQTKQAGNSLAIDENEKAKKVKCTHKALNKKQEKESASSRKVAKAKLNGER